MYKVYAKEPTPYIKIKFSEGSGSESNFDYLMFYYPLNGKWYATGKISGNFGNREVILPVKYFYLYWYTDNSVSRLGWSVESIEAVGYSAPEAVSVVSGLPSDGGVIYTTIINITDTNNPTLPNRPSDYGNNERRFWEVTYSKSDPEGVCIYNDTYMTDEVKAINPSLTLTEGNAGEFTIKLPPTNIGYDYIRRMTTEIIVEDKGIEIWSGRVISSKEDFQKNRTFTCEGELAYLNDTTQPQKEYNNTSILNFLSGILNVHNLKDAEYGGHKQFQPGFTTVTANMTYNYTTYDTTYKTIAEKLVDKLGGYIHLRKENGIRYLDYISETDRPTSSQEIQFGTNLLDFTKSYNSTDFCTVLLPLGKRIGNEYSDDDVLNTYTTVEAANDGSPYVINDDAVAAFGWIEATVNFSDIEDPEELLYMAQLYLSTIQFDNLVLDVKAVDLGYLGADYEKIHLSEQVRVVSRPHGLDRYFPVQKITIPLDNPANSSFTLGAEEKITMSARSISGNTSLAEAIEALPTKNSLLNAAKKNAADIINSFTTGYITVTQRDNGSQELYISDKPVQDGYDPLDPIPSSSRFWRWNLNGLAYFNKNDANWESNPRLALTMDGSIVADRVKTGLLSDLNGNFYLNMETGELKMKNGTFSGTISASTINGSTINSSTMNLGGSSNGAIYMYDSSNRLRGEWTKSNFTLYNTSGNSVFSTSGGDVSMQGSLHCGDSDNFIDIYGNVVSANDGNAYINFNGWGSSATIELYGEKILLNSTELMVTKKKGATAVYTGANGWFGGLWFCDGICCTVEETDGASGTVSYKGLDGKTHYIDFAYGLCTAIR